MILNELIEELKGITITSSTFIPIELVMELDRIRKEINKVEISLFINEEGIEISNEHWEDFKFTGLNNIDYITSEFYKGGFEDVEDDY